MTVEAQELETEVANTERDSEPAGGGYPTGGEVSALTLIQDVRAIRQRLDGIEVAIRNVGVRIEELPGAAAGSTGATAAPVGSLDELRKALLGDLQTDLGKNAKRATMMMGALLLTMLLGLGGVGWLVHQLSKALE